MIQDEFVDVAFRNSYAVIIDDKDAQDLITNSEGYFIHHPAKPISLNILHEMKEYFSSTEEFEKCIKILKYIEHENIAEL